MNNKNRSTKEEMTLDKLAEMVAVGFGEVGNRLDLVDSRLDRVESGLHKVESRLDKVESRLDSVEKKVDRLENQIRVIDAHIAVTENNHNMRIVVLENQMRVVYPS